MTAESLIIRDATADDTLAIVTAHEELYKAELVAASIPVEHGEVQITTWEPRERRAEGWGAAINSNPNLFFKMVELDGEVVGLFTGVILYPKSSVAVVGRINLHPKIQRQGIGAKLMTQFHSEVPPGRSVQLDVLEGNSGAIHFYQKLGYLPTCKAMDVKIGGYNTRRIEMQREGVKL